jgi:hypothetical protein
MRIICVNTGYKFSEWYVQNLKHMIDTYSGLKYSSFEVIRDNNFEGVFNKLQMFEYFKDGENLYFDLDIVIKDKVPNLIRKDFTVLHAWWREEFHTPLNSSVISWTGDQSHIFKKFKENPDYYMTKYHRGIDQYLYENIEYKTYDKICYSIQNNEHKEEDKDYSICLFNQRKMLMEDGWCGWWKKYFIPYF